LLPTLPVNSWRLTVGGDVVGGLGPPEGGKVSMLGRDLDTLDEHGHGGQRAAE
jgi:hypothetical protein